MIKQTTRARRRAVPTHTISPSLGLTRRPSGRGAGNRQIGAPQRLKLQKWARGPMPHPSSLEADSLEVRGHLPAWRGPRQGSSR